MIGHFRRYVTEHLLNTKVVVFLGISVACDVFFISKRVLNSRKLVIELGNFCFCLKMGDSDKIGKTLLGESVIL